MTFESGDGDQLNVATYWERKYGALEFPRLPCADASKSRKKLVYLPLEVCRYASQTGFRHPVLLI